MDRGRQVPDNGRASLAETMRRPRFEVTPLNSSRTRCRCILYVGGKGNTVFGRYTVSVNGSVAAVAQPYVHAGHASNC